jgi:competence protein ComEA
MNSEWFKQNRNYALMFLLNLAVVIGVIYLLRRETPRQVVVTQPPTRSAVNSAGAQTSITIVISGAVRQPGTLQLPGDARVADALDKAGVKPEADLSSISLTRPLRDGDKINVPVRAVNPAAVAASTTPSSGQAPTVDTKNISPAAERKINLNTATLEELDTLPGIGPALAQRIIDYRVENGGFQTIEELIEVKGIGDTLFNDLKEMITVE